MTFKDGVSGKWGKFRKANIVEFKKDFAAGMLVDDLAIKYGVNNVSINNWRKYLQLRRPRLRPDLALINKRTKKYVGEDNPAYGYRKLDWITRGIAKKLYKMYGKNYELVARSLDVSPHTVRKLLAEIAVPVKRGHLTADTVYVEKIKGKSYNTWSFYKWNSKVQDKIRVRENNLCFMCSSVCMTGRKLAIHHIFDDLQMADDHQLVALCASCHCKVTRGNSIEWRNYFVEKMSMKYSYAYGDKMEEVRTQSLRG